MHGRIVERTIEWGRYEEGLAELQERGWDEEVAMSAMREANGNTTQAFEALQEEDRCALACCFYYSSYRLLLLLSFFIVAVVVGIDGCAFDGDAHASAVIVAVGGILLLVMLLLLLLS